MPQRDRVMTVRLSDEEEALREALELHLGTDGASVMRMALLELGRARGVEPLNKKERPPVKAGRRRNS